MASLGRVVVVEVRHGFLGEGRIRVDGVRSKVLRDTGGWYVVQGVHAGETARVLYRDRQDLIVICWPSVTLRIPFHDGEGHFGWEGRPYRITTMIEGELRIDQDGRPVVRGHTTPAGVHLDTVATELTSIIRSLAWGLTLRSERI